MQHWLVVLMRKLSGSGLGILWNKFQIYNTQLFVGADRFQGDIGNMCLVSVDGTDFQIYQWKPFWRGWFSHKFKGPGVRYEVGLCIMTGHIVWIHGPFPCGKWPDLKIFRNAMKQQLSPGEKVQADLGYRGEPDYIVLPTGVNDIGQRVRARHETVNKRFKQWGILHRVLGMRSPNTNQLLVQLQLSQS